jgi:aminomethyltransferase
LSRTGYTGEPLCFELFFAAEHAPRLWDQLIEKGAVACGLGARDTLRLEAGLPLYGHELGIDPEGREIQVFSSPLTAFAVSTSAVKGDFVGRTALVRQQEAYRSILAHDFSRQEDLPRLTRPVAVLDRGVARAGSRVWRSGVPVGWVTSGTMVPYWKTTGEGLDSRPTEEYGLRSICLALLDSHIEDGDELSIEVRGRSVKAVVVPYHLRGDAPPYARPIVHHPSTKRAPPAARRA